MSQVTCKTCMYFKMVADPMSKQMSKVCFANPPVVSALLTQQGIAMLTNRPPVSEVDFCHLHKAEPAKIAVD